MYGMGVFGFGKKKSYTVDLTKMANSSVPQPSSPVNDTVDLREKTQTQTSPPTSAAGMDFLNTMASSTPTSNPLTQVSEMSELKIQFRKLTSKLEDSENDVYRLMQRIELLEKKIERFESRGN